jgi:hypothetical protein
VRAAVTVDGQVYMAADTRVLPQLRMVSTRVLPQLRLARCTHWPGVHDSRRVHNVVAVAVLRRVRMAVDACVLPQLRMVQVHTTADARVQS